MVVEIKHRKLCDKLHTDTSSSVKIGSGAPDPEFCYPAGSESILDPATLDPAGTKPDPDHLDLAGSGAVLLCPTYLLRL